MTREICKGCGRVSAVGFSVPDEVWNRVVENSGTVLCISCFAARADDCGLHWDLDTTFWPVSLATHLSDDPSAPDAVGRRDAILTALSAGEDPPACPCCGNTATERARWACAQCGYNSLAAPAPQEDEQ